MRVLKITDRTAVRVFAVVSVFILAVAAAVRASAPSPFAPRVHVRWSAGVDEGQRASLEREFSLLNGGQREDDTWEYDLADPSSSSINALVEHPSVADTHHIDRGTGSISPDAPTGTVRLDERRFASFVHSFFFDWFLLFWASSLIVSSVWLASTPNRRD